MSKRLYDLRCVIKDGEGNELSGKEVELDTKTGDNLVARGLARHTEPDSVAKTEKAGRKPKSQKAVAIATARIASSVASAFEVNGVDVEAQVFLQMAFNRSGLSVEDWNAQDDATIEELINSEVLALTTPATDDSGGDRYHAEHRGGGRWYVIDEDTGNPVEDLEPMSKDEAQAKAEELNEGA